MILLISTNLQFLLVFSLRSSLILLSGHSDARSVLIDSAFIVSVLHFDFLVRPFALVKC